jgi:hypothetical protein
MRVAWGGAVNMTADSGLASWDGFGAQSRAGTDAQFLLAALFPENDYGTQLFEYYTSIPDSAGHRGRP